MPTPLLENITLPKTYEEFQAFFDTHFKLRQRLARAHYHSAVGMKRQGRMHQDLAGKDWNFNPVVLLCPCTQEFTDVIPIETWTADSTVTCSACGKVYTEKRLKLLDEIKVFVDAKAKQIELEKRNPAYATEHILSPIDYSNEYNKIATLFHKPIDPLVVPAFAYKDLSWVNYKNTVSTVDDLKESDTVISMTAMSLTLDLMQTAKAKWIYKLSINRETLAFNKNDHHFRSSYYRSGRYVTDRGGFLARTGKYQPAALTDAMPVIKGRPQSGVVGLSMKDLISKIKTFSTIFEQCGPLKYGYVASTSQLTKSGIVRLTPGLRLMETFMNRVHAQFDSLPNLNSNTEITTDDVLARPKGYVVEGFLSSMCKKLFQVFYADCEQNIKLLSDAANLNFFDLSVYLHENDHFEINARLHALLSGEQFSSIRQLLRTRLNLSKRGVKAYLTLAKQAGERLRGSHIPYTFLTFGFVDTIKDPAISYAFLNEAIEEIEYQKANPSNYGDHSASYVFMTDSTDMLKVKLGRKYKEAAQNFYHKLVHRTLLSGISTYYIASDIMSSANTLANRLYKLSRNERKETLDEVIDFFNTQSVGGLHACEQAFLALQDRLLESNPAYEALVKSDFIELNQSKSDYETYERIEGKTSFTIPNHGLDMSRVGSELSLCVGGTYYQQSVASNQMQIVIAKRDNKKVVLEITKPSKTQDSHQTEGYGTIAQAKTRFNHVYTDFPEMLDDIKSYIAHLKLSVQTYDLPKEFLTLNK